MRVQHAGVVGCLEYGTLVFQVELAKGENTLEWKVMGLSRFTRLSLENTKFFKPIKIKTIEITG